MSTEGTLSKSVRRSRRRPTVPAVSLNETNDLRRRLAETEAELKFYKTKSEWLQSALASQQHARQLLEASLSTNYNDTVARIREVVRSLVPPQATVLVVSKGDQELLKFEEHQGWHFPQCDNGEYAGHHPADSAAAIDHLQEVIAKGAEFLLLPNTAFWWLEFYRDLEAWLRQSHNQVWRDEVCAIYRLTPIPPSDRHAGGLLVGRPTAKRVATIQGPGAGGPLQVCERAFSIPTNGDFAPSGHEGEHCSTSGSQGVAKVGTAGSAFRPDIYCFPIIDWGFRFQRPQHLMLRFAAAGHRVYYLSHQFRKTGSPCQLHPIGDGLWEVSLRGPKYHAHHRVLDEGHREALFEALSELRRQRPTAPALAIIQSPFWWPLAKQVATEFAWTVIYDCMDHHAGFSSSNPLLIEQERELLSHADLVVASSAPLELQARPYARKLLLVRNGCDYNHFASVTRKPRGARPVIGYYGAIADWFDSTLVADLAEHRPDWDFVLVGSAFLGDVQRLTRLGNVTLPGERPYSEMPAWLAKFDVAILPFKRNPLTDAANPVKAYEIMAAGKPLVSVPLPEMVSFVPLVRLATTAAEFEAAIQSDLNEADPSWEERRRQFARGHTWQDRFEQLSQAVLDLVSDRNAQSSVFISKSLIPEPSL